MLYQAALLIQDIQLLCFTIVFGVLAFQKWSDRTRRWLWFTFLCNAAGAVIDLMAGGLPTWLTRGLNIETIPLSYAMLNIVLVYFDRRKRTAIWLSLLPLLLALPILLAWHNHPAQVRSYALGDLLIALECAVTVPLLLCSSERSTRAPRVLMGGFMAFFVCVELARFWVAFPMHGNPDVSTPGLALTSTVTYVVTVSLLPLAFVWMMQARLEWELLQQSLVDPLTGVLNRRGLGLQIERELANFRRYDEEMTVALLDVDHFKHVNDRYGHAAGDTILVTLAGFLTRNMRVTDIVSRIGGEEFLMLLPRTSLASAAPILERLNLHLREETVPVRSENVWITASMGVTCTDRRRNISADELLDEADRAMYQAKSAGRDRICYHTSALPFDDNP